MEYTNTKPSWKTGRTPEPKLVELERTHEAAKELENRITNNKGTEAYDYTLVETMYQEKFNTLQAANTRKTQLEGLKPPLQTQISEG